MLPLPRLAAFVQQPQLRECRFRVAAQPTTTPTCPPSLTSPLPLGPAQVIMDSMAALKIMFEAAAMPGGEQRWADEALSHSRRVARELFRPGGGSYHGARFDADSGEVEWRGTFQGYADNSTWSRCVPRCLHQWWRHGSRTATSSALYPACTFASPGACGRLSLCWWGADARVQTLPGVCRGQAWAVVGFTHAANITGEPDMLAAARRAADYFMRRLAEAEDGVPLWDFDVPPSAEQVRRWRRRRRRPGPTGAPRWAAWPCPLPSLGPQHASPAAELPYPAFTPPPRPLNLLTCSNPVQPWKDSSAAAIAASGLLRLGELSGEERYSGAGAALLASLAGGYLGWEAGQGRQPLAALLRNGTFNVAKGSHSTGLIWGDYYILDALAWATAHNLTSSCAPPS